MADDVTTEQSSLDSKDDAIKVGKTVLGGDVVLLDRNRLWIGDNRGRCLAVVTRDVLQRAVDAISDEDPWRFIPVEESYEWPPVASIDDHRRCRIDEQGRPWIDGHRVNTTMHQQFQKEWSAFYDASRCDEPHCDGDRGHTGNHFAWTAG